MFPPRFGRWGWFDFQGGIPINKGRAGATTYYKLRWAWDEGRNDEENFPIQGIDKLFATQEDFFVTLVINEVW